MIIRKEATGELTLVLQTDHSRFVGQLAAHWGNQDIAAPQPYESVVRAASFHDFGYLNWEPDPSIDPGTGEPYQFRSLPFSQRQLDAYQWCVDWLYTIDPYAGVLVSKHRTGLWKGRYGTISHPTAFNPTQQRPEIAAFIERQEAFQDQGLDGAAEAAATLPTSYRLLQVWDLLGLYFGCQEPGDDFIEPVPTTYAPDDPGLKLEMHPVGDRRVAFHPFPFDRPGLKVQMPARRLSQARFDSVEAFRRAFYQAEVALLEYTLDPA